MGIISNDLYERYGSGNDTLTHRGFSMAISFFVMMNIGIAALGAKISYNWDLQGMNTWAIIGFFIVCLLVSVGGGALAHSSDDSFTSVLGGGICAVAMGVMVGPFVALYETSSVLTALAITVGVVFVTGLIGAIIPQDLSGWGPPLLAGLLGLIVVSLLLPAIGFHNPTLLDYIGILLFCAIMMYDMNMAMDLDKTMNNAIDVAVNVFLNFANIFIRVLALTGTTKD